MKYKEVVLDNLDLRDVVLKLVTAAAEGELLCANYKGHMLYGDTVSLNAAYTEVTGKPYSYTFSRPQSSNSTENEVLDENNIKQTLLSRGHQIIEPQYCSTWDKFVNKYISKQGFIEIFNYALKILALVNKGCLSDAAAIYSSCPPSYHKNICILVKAHSTYGENFVTRVMSAQNIYDDTDITGETEYFSK